jgi:hypothetical protein
MNGGNLASIVVQHLVTPGIHGPKSVHTVTNECETRHCSGMLGPWLAARALLPFPRTLLTSQR